MKKYNFYAGPSYLDESVLNKAIELIENKEKLSFLEISHRSETITALFEETRSLIKELMNLKYIRIKMYSSLFQNSSKFHQKNLKK